MASGASDATQLRVMCVTVGDRLPDDRLALDLARASGLGVMQVQALGGRHFAVRFSCATPELCAAGLARLQAAHQLLAEVSVEGRRTLPRAPAAQVQP
jgi:hypothetical protein